MRKLNPYPKYKDSGVPWLGKIPARWEVCRIKNLFREKDKRSGDGSGVLLSLTRAYGLLPQAEASNRIASAEDLSKYKVCSPGELVMNRMQAWSGMFAVSRQEGLVSPDYSVFCAIGAVDVHYFEYLFKTPLLVDQFAQRSKGIGSGFNRLYTPDFGAIPIVVPSLEEQRAIARFLEDHDRLTRRYIRAQRRLIELLTEQKQALIQRAVTRGLDPDVPLKDSGIEWLGEIPKHWEVVRSKRTFTPRTELARANDIQLSATQAYGVIPQDEYERRVGRKIVKIFRHLEKRRHVEIDDFVISMRSFQGGLERAWAVGCIRSSYIVLRSATPVDVGYFGYLFKSGGYIKALQSTANFIRDGQDLNYHNFCAVDLPFPPIEEQRQIADYLHAALTDTAKIVERTEHEIDLIREYRTRLIADVVTGKLDVRGVSLPDLEEADDLGDLDDMEEDTELDDLDAKELDDADD